MPFNQAENYQILTEIKNAKTSNTLIPFIGAGFSTNISGYPTFKDFINNNISKRLCLLLKLKLENKLDLWNVFDGNPNEAIEYFIYTAGKGKNDIINRNDIFEKGKELFHEEVKTEFDKVERLLVYGNESEWTQHTKLVKIFNVIYTTNWDHSIEKACEYEKIGYNKYYYDSDKIIIITHEVNGVNRSKIIKLHGDYVNCKSLIACESDYFKRISMTTNEMDEEFRQSLGNNDFLFLGYSFSDINIKYTINQINIWKTTFSEKKNLFMISVDNPNELHSEKIKYYKEWLGIKIHFLFQGSSTNEEKKIAIRDFISQLYGG